MKKTHLKQKPDIILLQVCKFYSSKLTYCSKKKERVSILNCYYCQILERPSPFEPLYSKKEQTQVKKTSKLDSFYNFKK